MVLFIFNKTINQSLRLHLEELRSIDERGYNNEIQKLTDKIKENEEDKNSAKSKLQEYDSGNIIKKRITKLEQDAQDRRNAWMQQQRMYAHDIQEQVNLKNDEIDKLMNARRSNADLIQAKQIERQKEIRGELSGKPGIGSVVNSIDNAINSLNQRQNEIDRDIQRIRNDIEELGTHKQSTPPDLSIDRSALNEELTFSESADKKDQEERIKVSDQKIKEINRQIQTIQSEKEKLKDTYAIDKHNDTIQQTKALFRAILSNSDNYQHTTENQVGNAVPSANKNGGNNIFLLLKVLALFFLVFFIDTVPTITKLTVKTRYDDYFSGLEMERAIQSMDKNHEEGRKMIDLIEQTNSDLSRKLKAGFSDGISEHQMLPQDQILAQRIIAKTIYSNYRNLSTLFQSDEHVFEFPLMILIFFRRFFLKIPFISWFFKD